MLRKEFKFITGCSLSCPMPALLPCETYEDKEKCLTFLIDCMQPFHMLMYMNKYLRGKLKTFIKLARKHQPPEVLWAEMYKFVVMVKKVSEVDYCVDGARELMHEEMLQWLWPILDLLMTYTIPSLHENNDTLFDFADPNKKCKLDDSDDVSFNDKENQDTSNVPLVFEESKECSPP